MDRLLMTLVFIESKRGFQPLLQGWRQKISDAPMMCRCTIFIGMEVWQNVDGISLGQGKYTIEILKRFGMMDCKAITTPMASNLKLLSDASSETVDATMCRQMIGSLIYLMNMRPDICLLWTHWDMFTWWLQSMQGYSWVSTQVWCESKY